MFQKTKIVNVPLVMCILTDSSLVSHFIRFVDIVSAVSAVTGSHIISHSVTRACCSHIFLYLFGLKNVIPLIRVFHFLAVIVIRGRNQKTF